MWRRALPPALAAVVLAGCGTKPPKTPDVTTPGPPIGFQRTAYPAAGISFDVPGGWRKVDGKPPLVAAVATGTATVAVWRYPRTEPLPTTHAALAAAKASLVAAVAQRDPTFRLQQAQMRHLKGRRAIQVVGIGTVTGQRRRIRSTHVYSDHAELIIDEYAPPTVFDRVDKQVFLHVLHSLRLGKAKA